MFVYHLPMFMHHLSHHSCRLSLNSVVLPAALEYETSENESKKRRFFFSLTKDLRPHFNTPSTVYCQYGQYSIVQSNVSSVGPSSERNSTVSLTKGPILETLDYTIRIDSTLTFLYFDLYLYSLLSYHTTFIKISCYDQTIGKCFYFFFSN